MTLFATSGKLEYQLSISDDLGAQPVRGEMWIESSNRQFFDSVPVLTQFVKSGLSLIRLWITLQKSNNTWIALCTLKRRD